MKHEDLHNITGNWFSYFLRDESGEVVYIYKPTSTKKVFFVAINFRDFTWQKKHYLNNTYSPWPDLGEGAGLCTLLYAIQKEL